ncbi:biotin transporter BioY [Qiania dongpingensis]|uniref:Biotin transporter n=1 Tax=Qiania dongpingensis TaxID=2763669 RepID=A0A7G9G383_9FIRM|nr:biotin transporter BioY [Qiania dongpingensis]QNM05265.1 biotin transporter BioY [Qiania dongpingensis]
MEKSSAKKSAKPALSIMQMTLIGVMTAVTCILAPLVIPLPISPVPISFTNLAVYISLYVLGMKAGTISYLVYLLIGLVGVPVFSGFTGGPAKLAGPTGGYLVGFLFMALIAGYFIDRFSRNHILQVLGMILGTAVCYLFGTVWLCIQMKLSFPAGLMAGVVPYLPGDAAKIVLAALVGPVLKRAVSRLKDR